jgi:iron-sulfur cluster assembly enzyme ISCU, mitochondrial
MLSLLTVRSTSLAVSRAMAVAATRSRRGYHENIVEHYENPRNVGSLDKNDDNVGTVRIYNKQQVMII